MKYPIGQQTFSKIIEGNFTYVDKTAFVGKLVANEGYYFLSRPRRFGKSLLLSTLHAYFNGERDLFKGLALDTMDVDWTPTPVLHFDFNSENYREPNGLSKKLDLLLRRYEREYGITDADYSLSGRFGHLIETVYAQTGRRIAVLIDEYDKPLLGIEDNPELFAANQALLKGFFGNLKSMDRCIRFGMLTGVARFNKVSIFSDLNNLRDISLSNEFADICGWTEEEMVEKFRPGIEQLAKTIREDFDPTVDTLRTYYDGYRFAEKGNRLYNPYSVLTALADRRIGAYWFDTGTPDFLARRVRKYGIVLPELNHQTAKDSDLITVGIDTGNPVGLMFQTGYLTIESYDFRRRRYTLRFPNREVEIGFAEFLYPLYVKNGDKSYTPFSIDKFQEDIDAGDPEGFMKRLKTLIKDMPYELQNEGNYQSIVWLLTTLCASAVTAERHSYKGRSDLEIKTTDYIYLFEFKYNETPAAAIAQLHDRDYAGRLALDTRTVFQIGANFSSDRDPRGLTGWIIERIK